MRTTQQSGQSRLANAFQLIQSKGRGRNLILVPETIGLFELLKLQAQQATNCGSKESSNNRLFQKSTHQQVNIVSVSGKGQNIQQLVITNNKNGWINPFILYIFQIYIRQFNSLTFKYIF